VETGVPITRHTERPPQNQPPLRFFGWTACGPRHGMISGNPPQGIVATYPDRNSALPFLASVQTLLLSAGSLESHGYGLSAGFCCCNSYFQGGTKPLMRAQIIAWPKCSPKRGPRSAKRRVRWSVGPALFVAYPGRRRSV
jgi:hypothetical protein